MIVTRLRLVSDRYPQQMHIAVSRALQALRIVGVQSEVETDPDLASLRALES